MTKFGKAYINHPTPKWIVILQITIEYCFVSIATGSFIVPDEWTWWKYVVGLSGFLAGLMTKLKPYFGTVKETNTEELTEENNTNN